MSFRLKSADICLFVREKLVFQYDFVSMKLFCYNKQTGDACNKKHNFWSKKYSK